MREEAHAKINLLLSVHPGPDERGYHRVDTIMVPLALHDDVDVCLCDQPGIEFSCTPDPLPPGSDPSANLAYRAAVAMGACFERPLSLSISVHKRIPSQAGLGGGSSNAAAVIRALARLWDIASDDERLLSVAASLGADVPFFLYEKPLLLGGYGDSPEAFFEGFKRPVVLVKPAGGVSTMAAYRALDELAPEVVAPDAMAAALERGTVDKALGLMANTMEGAARGLLPELDEVFAFLASQSERVVAGPLLCGSGSCVAAFVATAEAGEAVAEEGCRRGWWAVATYTHEG